MSIPGVESARSAAGTSVTGRTPGWHATRPPMSRFREPEQLELRTLDLVEQLEAFLQQQQRIQPRRPGDIPPYPSRRWENVPTGDYL